MTDRVTHERLLRLEAICFPVDMPELPSEREDRLRRAAEERCTQEQYERMSARMVAEGKVPWTFSEWASGCMGEDELVFADPTPRFGYLPIMLGVAAMLLIGWALFA